jgi:type IV pilus assembly protein PilN
MRIPINLASEPFRRDRPLMLALAAASALLAISLVVMISLMLSARDRAAENRTAVLQLNRQLQTLANEQAKLNGTLLRPENAEVLERSLLLNTLISRKGISWTRIFTDLEKVMPHNVRLVYVRLPQIDHDNQVTLDMVVAAESPEPVVDFLRRIERSPLFGASAVSTFLPPAQNEPLWRYRVTVSYAQRL